MELSGRALFLNPDLYPLRRYLGERIGRIGRLAKRNAGPRPESARIGRDIPQIRALVERSRRGAAQRIPASRQAAERKDASEKLRPDAPIIVLVLALDTYNGRVYHDMLEVRGYYPITAIGVDNWLGAVDGCTPDLILVDLCASDHPSIDITRTIMNDPRIATVPIVMITDAYKSGDLSDPSTILADCDGRITKPVSVEGFYRPIEEVLKRTTGQRRSPR